jgi:hypothetical protein
MKPHQKGSVERLTFIELIMLLVCMAVLGTIILSTYTGRGTAPTGPRLQRFDDPKKGGLAFHAPAFDHNDTFPMSVTMANGGTTELAGIGVAGTQFLVISNEWSTPNFLFRPGEFDPAGNWVNSFGSTGAGGGVPFTNP